MNPIAFEIAGLQIYWYGILIVISVLAGAYVSTIQARKRDQDPERVWDALLVCLILGIVGARLYHVFSSPQDGSVGWSYYRENPKAILMIWEGGLALLGAIIGGSLGMVLFAGLARLPILTWLDIGAHGLLLAQTIGRWGNYFNQEMHGPPTTLPWGILVDPGYRIAPFTDVMTYPVDTLFHPTFLYESIWCLIGFIFLWWVSNRFHTWLRPGDEFCLYGMWYAVGRFLVEFMRPGAWMIGPFAAAQVFCILGFVLGLGAIFFHHRSRPDAPAVSESQVSS